MAEFNLVEAVNLALHHEMSVDERVVVLGEDVGVNGGVFRATLGLREKFGFKRVMDTPLAEALIAGMAVGMATQGLRPVAEFQFQGFIFPGSEQLVCHAARMRNRTRGRLSCPLVYRAPYGGGIHAPEHHSESVEAMYAHVPGLKIVIPSSPKRAYGLLLAAIRDPDPVLFFEPKRIYRSFRHHFEDDGQALPLGHCFTLREGSELTLVSWGAQLVEVMQACEQLEQEGIGCHVLDAATIRPLDLEAILASVSHTGRLLVVHEACRSFGVGAEIVATVCERLLTALKAPPKRLCGWDTVMPYYKNENHYMIHAGQIASAARQLMEFRA